MKRNLVRSFVRDPEPKILHSQKRCLYSCNSPKQFKKKTRKDKHLYLFSSFFKLPRTIRQFLTLKNENFYNSRNYLNS